MPADGQAVAAHIAHHTAALLHRIPEPPLVRTGVLLVAADQQGRAHRVHHSRHLLPHGRQGLHVDLVLEVGGRHVDLAD